MLSLGILIPLWAAMVATSLLAGVFGMAGGMILIGILLVLLPLPEAMALHAVTQIASNGWRALFGLREVRWRIVGAYAVGLVVAMAGWSAVLFVPEKPLALIALGLSPFVLMVLPARLQPDPERPLHAAGFGVACMSLMLLTGVPGPLLDRFFLGGRLDRLSIVATKAMCQVLGHTLKLVYFGAVVTAAGTLDPVAATGAVIASMLGTLAARPLLAALTDTAYRRWAGRIVTALALAYIVQGTWLLVRP